MPRKPFEVIMQNILISLFIALWSTRPAFAIAFYQSGSFESSDVMLLLKYNKCNGLLLILAMKLLMDILEVLICHVSVNLSRTNMGMA